MADQTNEKLVKPQDKESITWTGNCGHNKRGKVSEEHPALVEKLVAAGYAVKGKVDESKLPALKQRNATATAPAATAPAATAPGMTTISIEELEALKKAATANTGNKNTGGNKSNGLEL